MKLFLLFLLIENALCETVTPDTNGAGDIMVVIGETREDGGNTDNTDNELSDSWYIENFDSDRVTEWPVTVTMSRDAYCFDEDQESIITIVIQGSCPNTEATNIDLFMAFEVNGKYMATVIDFDEGVTPWGVYPYCGEALAEYPEGTTNLADGAEQNFRYDLAQSDADGDMAEGGVWDYIYNEYNGDTWPVTVTLTNDDVNGKMTFTLETATMGITSCEYDDTFDTGYDVLMYLSTDDSYGSEDMYFDSFEVTSTNTGTASCPDSTIETFDWDTMTEEGTNIPEYSDLTMSVDDTDLSLDISVTLTYEANAYADSQETNQFGVTYVIDFEDFDAHETHLYEPGTCQNRVSDDFYVDGNLRDFSDWWEYSSSPADGNVGTSSYMAYPPPSDYWTIESNGCDTVTYTGSFTWKDLLTCSDASETLSYVSVTSGDSWLNLSGTLYINVVSPFWYESDMGYYRVYQILSQPFVIAVSTSIYVLDSTGINLFTMAVIAVYKEQAEGVYRLIVLTESAEYLRLTRTEGDESLNAFSASGSVAQYTGASFTASDEAITSDIVCLSNKDYICSQLWEIRVDGVVCEEDTVGTDFSGTYSMDFIPICRSGITYEGDDDYCTTWLEDHPTISVGITLMTELFWEDNNCDPEVFTVQFDAQYNFYYDEFENSIDDFTEEYLFQVGTSTIYAEIETTFPEETYEVFETELQNVWICTFPPDTDVIDADESLESGGCFSGDIDISDFTTHIYEKDVVTDLYDFDASYTAPDTNYVRFSFTVPYQVARDSLYIHSHVEVALVSGTRRLLMEHHANTDITNRMEHFGEMTGIDYGQEKKPFVPDVEPPLNYVPSLNVLSLSDPYVVSFIALISMILFVNIAYVCYSNCYSKSRKSGYASVKVQDSEAQSEADQLNPE